MGVMWTNDVCDEEKVRKYILSIILTYLVLLSLFLEEG